VVAVLFKVKLLSAPLFPINAIKLSNSPVRF